LESFCKKDAARPAGEANNLVPLFSPHTEPEDDFVMAEVGIVVNTKKYL
jgi:hypothetical protein